MIPIDIEYCDFWIICLTFQFYIESLSTQSSNRSLQTYPILIHIQFTNFETNIKIYKRFCAYAKSYETEGCTFGRPQNTTATFVVHFRNYCIILQHAFEPSQPARFHFWNTTLGPLVLPRNFRDRYARKWEPFIKRLEYDFHRRVLFVY